MKPQQLPKTSKTFVQPFRQLAGGPHKQPADAPCLGQRMQRFGQLWVSARRADSNKGSASTMPGKWYGSGRVTESAFPEPQEKAPGGDVSELSQQELCENEDPSSPDFTLSTHYISFALAKPLGNPLSGQGTAGERFLKDRRRLRRGPFSGRAAALVTKNNAQCRQHQQTWKPHAKLGAQGRDATSERKDNEDKYIQIRRVSC